MAVQPSGVNWGPSVFPAQSRFLGWSNPCGESISHGEGGRGSDEAIVSDDPEGQYNPLVSQGPLDERVGVGSGHARLERS
jgi:hypothetical protein